MAVSCLRFYRVLTLTYLEYTVKFNLDEFPFDAFKNKWEKRLRHGG
jgi:hypothetical protein